MHPRIIYEIRHEIAYPLTLLFNKSLESKQYQKFENVQIYNLFLRKVGKMM